MTDNNNNIYLDCLENTDEDIMDMQKITKSKGSKGDKIYISVMAALNVCVLVFIGVFLALTGNADEFDSIKTDAAPEPEIMFFDASKVFSGDLAPTINGVIFPDGMQNSFKRIYSENQDVIGWVRLNGTSIDYPVMQAEDNDKYHRTNFYLEHTNRGSIWMDYRCRVGVNKNWFYKNTIIYGHHLSADECIFAELENYMDVDFYKTHPIIEMNTIYENYKWKVFACIVTNVEEKDDNGHVFYYWTPYITDEKTVAFTDEILRRSWFVNPAVDILPEDKLLTLSTCTYIMNQSKFYDMRCVVFARLIRDGESEEVDMSTAYQNENKRMPQVWYNQHGIENPYKSVPVYGE